MRNNNKNYLFFGAIVIILLLGFMYYRGRNSGSSVSNSQPNNIINNNQVKVDENPPNNPDKNDKNGRYIGYVKKVVLSGGIYSLTIDFIQWITPCDPAECPKGYKIADVDPLQRTYPILNDAPIKMQTLSKNSAGDFNLHESVSSAQFEKIINTDGRYNTGSLTVQGIPFWITLNNGTVVQIEEQFIP